MRLQGVIMACLTAFPIAAQPFLPQGIYVVHTASRRPPQSPETGLAPGSMFDIGLTGVYQPIGSIPRDQTVSLRFRAPSAQNARELTIISQKPAPFGPTVEFTAIVPSDTSLGQAEISAVFSGGSTITSSVWIADSNFGIFTKATAGYDAAIAQFYRNGPSLIGLTNPVQPGEWVTIWGTGLGNSARRLNLTIEVGGTSTTPDYAGPAPGLAGIDQINFQLPAGVAADCYIPISVKLNGRSANVPTIATASGLGPCPHRLGLTADSLATLDQGGRVPLSQAWIHSDVIPAFDNSGAYRRYDTVSMDFMQYDAAGVQTVTRPLSVPVAGCELTLNSITAAGFLEVRPLDSGTPVVTGPDGLRIPMEGSLGHYYTNPSETNYTLATVPPSSFKAGDWAVEAPGGNDVGAFRVPLRVPPPLRWTNRASMSSVARDTDLVLLWDPDGYTDREWMQGSIGAGGSFIACQAPATAGSIKIPAALISQLTQSATPAAPMVQLLMTSVPTSPLLYKAPLTAGGFVPGLSTFSYLEAVPAGLK